jgi:hypothetical protein
LPTDIDNYESMFPIDNDSLEAFTRTNKQECMSNFVIGTDNFKLEAQMSLYRSPDINKSS